MQKFYLPMKRKTGERATNRTHRDETMRKKVDATEIGKTEIDFNSFFEILQFILLSVECEFER